VVSTIGTARREARTLLEQQLVSHYPNAWQCGRASLQI